MMTMSVDRTIEDVARCQFRREPAFCITNEFWWGTSKVFLNLKPDNSLNLNIHLKMQEIDALINEFTARRAMELKAQANKENNI